MNPLPDKFFEKEHSGKVLKGWQNINGVLFVIEERPTGKPDRTMGSVQMTFGEADTLADLLREVVKEAAISQG